MTRSDIISNYAMPKTENSDNHIVLRLARPDDAPRLCEIYNYYVESTTVTLECEPLGIDEFASRIRETLGEFPYIVCEYNDRVAGYAYAHKFKTRYGYRFCAELSVYADREYRRRGIGRALYAALIELLSMQGYTNLYGVVTSPNPASEALHRSFGFTEVGREHLAGHKFGEWFDVAVLEYLTPTPRDTLPESPRRFDSLETDAVARILSEQ